MPGIWNESYMLQSSRTLSWAEGNPLSEYQKEYYRKQLLRHQARQAQARDAGETLCRLCVPALSLSPLLCSDRLFGEAESALRSS